MPPQMERIMLSADGANPLRWNPQQGVLPLQGWNALAGGLWPELRKRMKTSWVLFFFVGDTEAEGESAKAIFARRLSRLRKLPCPLLRKLRAAALPPYIKILESLSVGCIF